MTTVERHHWLNTYLGILDAAFNLTDGEQAHLIVILRDLLRALSIPERGTPAEVPATLAVEVSSGFHTIALAGPRESQVQRPVRAVVPGDVVVSVEAWRDALLGMLQVAYPDLDPAERLLASKVFADCLTGIGLPHRASTFLPDDVVRVYRSLLLEQH